MVTFVIVDGPDGLSWRIMASSIENFGLDHLLVLNLQLAHFDVTLVRYLD